MGQAYDDKGQMLGETYGATKAEVFRQLNERFPDAAEIRIRHLGRLEDLERTMTTLANRLSVLERQRQPEAGEKTRNWVVGYFRFDHFGGLESVRR